MHRRHRSDDNQSDIVKALRKADCCVYIVGMAFDLVVRRSDRVYLLDCTGSTPNRKRDPEQLKVFEEMGVIEVANEYQALEAVGVITELQLSRGLL